METTTPTAEATVPDEFLKVGEVAKLLRVTPMTIYTEIHEGHLDAVRVGRKQFRIPMAAYRAYVARGQQLPVAEAA
jgi:excisionase family DNA binding protein